MKRFENTCPHNYISTAPLSSFSVSVSVFCYRVLMVNAEKISYLTQWLTAATGFASLICSILLLLLLHKLGKYNRLHFVLDGGRIISDL